MQEGALPWVPDSQRGHQNLQENQGGATKILSNVFKCLPTPLNVLRGEWPSGLYSLRQVTEVKLGRVRSDFGWVTSEA